MHLYASNRLERDAMEKEQDILRLVLYVNTANAKQ